MVLHAAARRVRNLELRHVALRCSFAQAGLYEGPRVKRVWRPARTSRRGAGRWSCQGPLRSTRTPWPCGPATRGGQQPGRDRGERESGNETPLERAIDVAGRKAGQRLDPVLEQHQHGSGPTHRGEPYLKPKAHTKRQHHLKPAFTSDCNATKRISPNSNSIVKNDFPVVGGSIRVFQP